MSSLYQDFGDYPEMMGGLLAVAEVRSEHQERKTGKAKLKDKDLKDPQKMNEWAKGRSADSKRNMAEADSALRKKFPGMMSN